MPSTIISEAFALLLIAPKQIITSNHFLGVLVADKVGWQEMEMLKTH